MNDSPRIGNPSLLFDRSAPHAVDNHSMQRIVAGECAPRYERHQPEKTLLYQIIDEYYPQFLAHMEQQGRSLPLYVQREFDDYLECGRLEYGCLRVRCEGCHHERLVAFSCTKSRRSRRAPRHLPQLWRQTNG